MWFALAFACAGKEDDDVDPRGSAGQAEELACSGEDEDGDGTPGSETPCVREEPDVVLEVPPTATSCCLRWGLAPGADPTGGPTAVLLELQYDAGADPTAETAWLLGPTVSGRADELAFASFTFADPPPTYAAETPPIAGEFDGEVGREVWVQRHLFTDPLGAVTGDDAIATIPAGAPVSASGDFDGDGIDDLFIGGNSVAWGPFTGTVEAETIEGVGGFFLGLFDPDGSGEAAVALSQGEGAAFGPVDVVRLDGSNAAEFPGPVDPVADIDGDGFEDALVFAPSGLDPTLYAGPFEGMLDPENHPIIASFHDDGRWLGLPDLDGDGGGELARYEYFTGIDILLPVTGRDVAFDGEVPSRFYTPSNLNSVPPGGPFVGDLGEGSAVDLAIGIIDDAYGWNTALHIFFEPLY